MAWLRVGELLVADDATQAQNVLNSNSLTRQALDDIYIQDIPNATINDRGIIELATSAETLAGVDGGRAVTPQTLKGAVDSWRPFRAYSVRAVIGVRDSEGGTGSFNFPSGTFTGVPRLAVTRATPTSALWLPYVVTSSATSATIGIYNTAQTKSTVDIAVDVLAIQMI